MTGVQTCALPIFRTLKAMEAATVEQLEETPGMTHLTALNLYRYLHENDGQ